MHYDNKVDLMTFEHRSYQNIKNVGNIPFVVPGLLRTQGLYLLWQFPIP